MTAMGQNLTLFQGETQTVRIPVTNASGAPITLTGASVVWRVTTASGATVLSKTSGGGGITLITTTITSDTIAIAIDPADTLGLAAATYLHECRITIDGEQAVVTAGALTLLASRTL